MFRKKRICFKLTSRRVTYMILVLASLANIFIVGFVFNTTSFSLGSTLTITETSSQFGFPSIPVTGTFLVPTSTVQEIVTDTLVPTDTPTDRFTPTNTSSQTPSLTPTYTVTLTSTPTFTPSMAPCIPQYSWPIYIVQRGDTLYSLALATGSSIYELKLASCLIGDLIYTGQVLYVPHMPIETPTVTPTEALSACTGFEDLNLGSAFKVGEKFVTSRMNVSVGQFVFSDGTSTSGGAAYVTTQGMAGGYAKEIQVNNVSLNFYFDFPPNGVSILFGEYGGNLNININGEFVNFENFADVNGRVIGSVMISVLNGDGKDAGFLNLSGAIKSLSVGGQELWIDNVCLKI